MTIYTLGFVLFLTDNLNYSALLGMCIFADTVTSFSGYGWTKDEKCTIKNFADLQLLLSLKQLEGTRWWKDLESKIATFSMVSMALARVILELAKLKF